jgi:uncharacterized protein (DUF849 family)
MAQSAEVSFMRTPINKVIITCAITGKLTQPGATPYLPIPPSDIASSALGAAEGVAAIVDIHVREPKLDAPSMELALYKEAVERIHARRTPTSSSTSRPGPAGVSYLRRMIPGWPRLARSCCTHLDASRTLARSGRRAVRSTLNTMNSGKRVVINTPGNVRKMAKVICESGVPPEIELFDSGDIALMLDLIVDGSLREPRLYSVVIGVPCGFQPSAETLLCARNLKPAQAQFTGIGIGRWMFPMVAPSYLAGGHRRVGFEDGIYLSREQLATSDAALVKKARRIVEDLGGNIATCSKARKIVGLPYRPPGARAMANA